MPTWLMYVIVVVVLVGGIYAFWTLLTGSTRQLSRHTDRTAEDMYGEFDDPPTR